MRLRYADAVLGAWAAFRRDRVLLTALSAPFLFLPALALALLVPGPPPPAAATGGGEADALAWADALTGWARAHGGWYLAGHAVQLFGAAAVAALYLDRARPDAAGALGRAAALWPRMLVAAAVTAVPVAAGLLLWVLPGLYVAGRVMLTAPVLVAEPPVGAVRAVARSLYLGRRSGLMLAALAGTPLAAGFVLGAPFDALAAAAARSGDPVTGAVAGLGRAGVAWGVALAQLLLAVSAYRLLSAGEGPRHGI